MVIIERNVVLRAGSPESLRDAIEEFSKKHNTTFTHYFSSVKTGSDETYTEYCAIITYRVASIKRKKL